MMTKKYQIFLSSTFTDLEEERRQVLSCILNMGHIPVGMELFNAVDDNQWGLIKKSIDTSDYYVLILSDRYGSVSDEGIGYTEKEYDYAIQQKIPVISFVRTEESISQLSFDHRESLHRDKLIAFKDKVFKKHIQKWNSASELIQKFTISLMHLIIEKPRQGWVRDLKIPAQNELFYTLDERVDNNFSSLIKDATKVFVLARTAVNLLSLYERKITELVNEGCDVRFMCVGKDSDAVKYIYGSNPELYHENAKKMKMYLDRIKGNSGKEIQVRTIKHAPTVSIIFVEKSSGESFVVVQFYFLHSRLGIDRPIFKLDKSDRWFIVFKEEFDKLWNSSEL